MFYLHLFIFKQKAATIESLLFWLEKLGFVVSMWDEGNMFLSGLGLYKKDKGMVYDRAVFNNLFNTQEVFHRDLVNNRQVIENPRLNMAL